MSSWISFAVLALYYLTLSLLAAYGCHRLVLVALYYRTRRDARPEPPPPATWPLVTVQLPVYNERYVAERLIAAAARLDYPPDRLEIQVLDDSDDDTSERIARQVAAERRRGIVIHHLRRARREGFKAGALAYGLKRARGELVAVFDADFLPRSDFLRRVVPWLSDPRVGLVQARWEHLNRDYSLLTRAQAILLDGHFVVEHTARHRAGCFFNFNGTAGVWRRRAIEEAGGWGQDTLTEDLDLSYRAQLAGWRFVFLPQVAAPAELPVEINAFKRQQFRWAKGSIQTARKLLRRVLVSDQPWRVKIEALVHLSNNSSYLLMLILSLLIFPAMMARRDTALETLLLIDLPLFVAATFSVLVFYATSQRAQGRPWRELLTLPALMALGMGLAVNNARAVTEGLSQQGGVFERTPKYRIEQQGDSWRGKRYGVARDRSFALEGLLALYLAGCFATAVLLELWLALPFLYLFLQGYAYMFAVSLLRGRARPLRWRRGGSPLAGARPGSPAPAGQATAGGR